MKKSVVSIVFMLMAIVVLHTGCQEDHSAKLSDLTNRLGELENELAEMRDHEVEVAPYMLRLHRYTNKVYYAGQQENTELVNFYLHEIEEIMEELESLGIYDNNIDISANIKTYGLTAIESFEERFSETEYKYFDEAYKGLINSCNSCHLVSGYPFIELAIPTEPAPSNQVFTPRK